MQLGGLVHTEQKYFFSTLRFSLYEQVQNEFSQQIVRECIQKFPDWVDNEIYAYNNKHSLRSNKKGYGGKTH
jgi:hypothetical protein